MKNWMDFTKNMTKLRKTACGSLFWPLSIYTFTYFSSAGIKCRALCVLAKCPTTEPHCQPLYFSLSMVFFSLFCCTFSLVPLPMGTTSSFCLATVEFPPIFPCGSTPLLHGGHFCWDSLILPKRWKQRSIMVEEDGTEAEGHLNTLGSI